MGQIFKILQDDCIWRMKFNYNIDVPVTIVTEEGPETESNVTRLLPNGNG